MHLDTVKAERAKYTAPLGYENAWKITNAVALAHTNEGWGLLEKTSGTNWQGYSIDVILNRNTGQAVDILGSSEEQGYPVWNPLSAADTPPVTRWRQPIGEVAPPTPNPGDPLETRVAALEQQVTRLLTTLRGV